MERFFLGKSWIKTGLIFGFLMFVIVGIGFAIMQGKMMTFQYLVINFVIMMLGGMVYGLLMKLYFSLISKK